MILINLLVDQRYLILDCSKKNEFKFKDKSYFKVMSNNWSDVGFIKHNHIILIMLIWPKLR